MNTSNVEMPLSGSIVGVAKNWITSVVVGIVAGVFMMLANIAELSIIMGCCGIVIILCSIFSIVYGISFFVRLCEKIDNMELSMAYTYANLHYIVKKYDTRDKGSTNEH